MSKHFQDARYYFGRAAEHTVKGIREELAPLRERVRSRVSDESEPEPSRLEKLQDDLREYEERAELEARRAAETARKRIGRY